MAHVAVISGLLPVKLNTGADRRELERAQCLIGSLGRNWRGECRFELHIVGLDQELDTIRTHVSQVACRYSNILIKFHKESDFFANSDKFVKLPGTYKQQIIKLFVPPMLRLGPFITFDADVICLFPFDEHTFVRDGLLISAWEPKQIHSWWENSSSTLRAWTDLEAPGLSVTPNILHSDICALVKKYFELRGLNALDELSAFASHHPYLKTYERDAGYPLCWSEYSLYNIVAEWFGMLARYHLPAEVAMHTGVEVQSLRSVWGASSVDRLERYRDHTGIFVIVQSWAGLPIEEVAARLQIPKD